MPVIRAVLLEGFIGDGVGVSATSRTGLAEGLKALANVRNLQGSWHVSHQLYESRAQLKAVRLIAYRPARLELRDAIGSVSGCSLSLLAC